ncbi:hypothetical protein V2H45_14955 [Tumidithrix elongata RA019]|uniref:Uncharacterized protein n=1 Tax=Tumidithrix elongata BACA0141 TaxID=2716417 RepID=A0AAW9Q0B5_9CYAN|nr:hypothetical protein [Tumidithrix elongata RA019]
MSKVRFPHRFFQLSITTLDRFLEMVKQTKVKALVKTNPQKLGAYWGKSINLRWIAA